MSTAPPPPASRNYPLLLVGQFLGAFGDNFLLKAILGPLTYALASGAITEARVNGENALFSLVFSIPFIVLAPFAGFLNDRMPKTTWLVGGNVVKILGAAIGLAGATSVAGPAGHTVQVLGYMVVGVGACVYSPAKYGILPEIVETSRLVRANGTVEMLTLVAIVSGLGLGGILYDQTLSLRACYGAGIALYAAAFLCNGAMTRTPCNPAARFRSSLTEFGRNFGILFGNPRLARILLGSALFWFAGSTLKSALQGWGLAAYAEAGVTHITNFKLVLLVIGMVTGIVAGAALAGRLHRTGDLSWSRRYGLMMALGLGLLGVLGGRLGLVPPVLALVGTGAAAGLLIVPLNAALQSESDPRRLGKTVSVQNFTDYIGIAAGGAYLALLTRLRLSPNQDLMVLGVTVALVTAALGGVGAAGVATARGAGSVDAPPQP
jgi:LPLT family lysophospholipid transporter-like MFS transporter